VRPPSGLIFDLDGTLVDTRRDLSVAINRVRSDYGWSALGIEEVTAAVGEGARVLVASALGVHRTDESIPESLDEALERFYRHYDDVCLDTSKPSPSASWPTFPFTTVATHLATMTASSRGSCPWKRPCRGR
jgi:phosphoglycolate phosphatase